MGEISVDILETLMSPVMKGISAKLIGDKGRISKELFGKLLQQNVTLITRIKSILVDITRKMDETSFDFLLCTLNHHGHIMLFHIYLPRPYQLPL